MGLRRERKENKEVTPSSTHKNFLLLDHPIKYLFMSFRGIYETQMSQNKKPLKLFMKVRTRGGGGPETLRATLRKATPAHLLGSSKAAAGWKGPRLRGFCLETARNAAAIPALRSVSRCERDDTCLLTRAAGAKRWRCQPNLINTR